LKCGDGRYYNYFENCTNRGGNTCLLGLQKCGDGLCRTPNDREKVPYYGCANVGEIQCPDNHNCVTSYTACPKCTGTARYQCEYMCTLNSSTFVCDFPTNIAVAQYFKGVRTADESQIEFIIDYITGGGGSRSGFTLPPLGLFVATGDSFEPTLINPYVSPPATNRMPANTSLVVVQGGGQNFLNDYSRSVKLTTLVSITTPTQTVLKKTWFYDNAS